MDLVFQQILRGCRQHSFEILAYCFMPDHLHLLIEGLSDDADAKQFIARAKQYSGFYYAKEFGKPLWQRYGYERVLRDDEVTMVAARYIFENPVRAGLIKTPEEYSFLGSERYELREILEAVAWSG